MNFRKRLSIVFSILFLFHFAFGKTSDTAQNRLVFAFSTLEKIKQIGSAEILSSLLKKEGPYKPFFKALGKDLLEVPPETFSKLISKLYLEKDLVRVQFSDQTIAEISEISPGWESLKINGRVIKTHNLGDYQKLKSEIEESLAKSPQRSVLFEILIPKADAKIKPYIIGLALLIFIAIAGKFLGELQIGKKLTCQPEIRCLGSLAGGLVEKCITERDAGCEKTGSCVKLSIKREDCELNQKRSEELLEMLKNVSEQRPQGVRTSFREGVAVLKKSQTSAVFDFSYSDENPCEGSACRRSVDCPFDKFSYIAGIFSVVPVCRKSGTETQCRYSDDAFFKKPDLEQNIARKALADIYPDIYPCLLRNLQKADEPVPNPRFGEPAP